jgi:lactate permease
MLTILAAIPLAGALAMMTLLQRNSRQAGLMTLVLVCAMAFVVPAFHLSPMQLLLSLYKGGATSLTVLTVILPALLLYHLQQATGGMNSVTQNIARLTSDRDLQVLLLVLGLSPFVESLCGFGVGIIVIAPMLLELRFGALRVALLCLLGQLTTAWGAMGVAVVLNASLTRLSVTQVGSLTALLSIPTTIVLSLMCLHLSGGKAAVRRLWLLAVAAAVFLTGGAWILSNTVGVELVGILSSTFTLLFLGGVGAIMKRLAPHPQGISHEGNIGTTNRESLWPAAFPYVLLTFFLLLSRLVPSLHDWLQTHAVLEFPVVHMSLPLLYIPGFWISLSLLIGIGISGTPRHVTTDVLGAAWRQFTPSALAILLFLLTAQVMQTSSMTASLGASASSLGSRYVWISPWLSGLGAWLTGSNLGGTAMFAQLQKAAASSTGLSLPWLAAAQNTAGQLARMLSPACLMLAATSAGLKGQEGLLIRKFGPLVLWAITLIMLLLTNIMTPSPLVICLLVVLLALPFLPTLRPVFLAIPALESGKVSSAVPRKPRRRVRGRTTVASRKKRAYTAGRRYKKKRGTLHYLAR